MLFELSWDDVVHKHVVIVASFNKYCRIALQNAFDEAFADSDITTSLDIPSIRSKSKSWIAIEYDREWDYGSDPIKMKKHCSDDGSFHHFCQPVSVVLRHILHCLF